MIVVGCPSQHNSRVLTLVRLQNFSSIIYFLAEMNGSTTLTDRNQWAEIGVLQAGIRTIERFGNAGLSEDGNLCFVTDVDEYWYAVYSLPMDKIIWQSRGYPELPRLSEWEKEGFIEITKGPAKARYRLFGLGPHHPLEVNEAEGIRIDIDEYASELLIVDVATETPLQGLKFVDYSGDWAFATFSDNYRVIAVIIPLSITFFSRNIDNGDH
jgi:hypothetical protein